jgi:SAM-dependent methyltransferase
MTDYANAWQKWFPIIERGARALSECMLDSAGLGNGRQVLDIATGIGEPALAAARRVAPGGRVLATDVSTGMLDFAAARAARAGIRNIEFRRLDANSLDLGERRFDAVTCRWGLMFVDDLGRTLGAIRELLVPGGRLAIGVWSSADEVPSLSLAARAIHRELGLPPPAEGAGTAFALADGDALGASLRAAGFEAVERRRVAVRYRYDSVDEYLRHRREVSTALAGTLADCRDDELARAWRAATEAMAPYRDADGKVSMTNIAFCVSAMRG